ncbi:ATP-binding cassette sub-family C member 10 isoform mrp7A [Mus musculus]|uniref:Isoform 2 of ATP-binding cassette sub-family C member 10 n=1 Tax=Mus musculus TaxID=10090 RepID=Q8R4P9-2|nr:ATP-binding cassette sub-family C member 10 isoform mrp7A [Mus musculus]AAM18535.1 multidrug resistance-associated protein 7A [Mus musculus]EDL23498.1 ATP-binding cassette, sub-family C (CFTR/MRP), member 10, isoform CRA_b [Mus musculus]|eukprot:NP_660122.1 multidrug resistance-associated protein 7 isoform mrp7A [Mus musculus]
MICGLLFFSFFPRTTNHSPALNPGWRLRLAASFLLSIFPLLDLLPVVLPPGSRPGPLWLEVLAGCVTAVAWFTHSLALWALVHSPHGRSRGPLALALAAFLPTPALVLTLLWHCQRGTFLPPLLPGPLGRVCLLILQLAAVLAYGLGWAAPGGPQEPWTHDPFLSSESQETEVAEDGESWLSRFSYAWLAPLLARGVRGELQQPRDTCRLPRRLHPAFLARVFQAHWKEGAQLWRALYRAFGCCYLALGLLKMVGTMLGFSGPLLLSLLVGFLEEGQEPLSHGLLYVLGLAGGTVISAVLQNQYGYEVRKVTLQARVAVLSTLYRKALKLGPSRPPTGEVLNLLGTDSERLLNFAGSFHEAWGLPLQLAITLYLLYQQVGMAFLAGLVLALLLVPVNKVIATRIMASNQEMLRHKDARVKLMTELLSGIRVIKFFRWEQALGDRVKACRTKELGRLRVIKYLDAACVYLWAALPVVICITIFITYVLMGHQLTATKVFTALALVRMLILPLNNFPWVINGLLESKVSLDRIQRFLDLPSYSPEAYYSPDPPAEPSTALELHEALFSWDPIGASQKTFISHLQVKKGMLVGIVGKVGCGKSSLLAAITGELHRLCGWVAVSELSKGFGLATQEPWIQCATIRDNILFGKTFDAQLYREVLEACALNDDLSILPAGDQTEVGEKGVTLSGGQRARIALARAVYQEKALYLLDDPLAAVDADVANHLLHRCILGVLSHTTRLLCTHRTEYLERADVVLLMEAGQLVRTGPPSEILPLVQAVPTAWAEKEQVATSGQSPSVCDLERTTEEELEVEQSTCGCLVQEESKSEGAVALHVYRAYWRAMGSGLAAAILVSLLLMQATRNGADWWLAHWLSQLKAGRNGSREDPASCSPGSTALFSPRLLLFSPGNLYTPLLSTPLHKAASNGTADVHFYLIVYATIAGVNSLCTLLRAVLFAAGALQAAASLHHRLLHRLLMAPVTFYDSTPSGRVLNRFSSDVACVDDSLPFLLNILLANSVGLLGLLAVLGSGLPWLLLLLPPLSFVYYSVQGYYRASFRELRRLGSLTWSPLYSHLADTLAGLPVLRAAGATYRFEEENQRLLELNQRCQFASYATMQWLDIRLQLMGAAVVSAIAGIALVQHQQGLANPGLVGLVLSYALSLTGLLSGLVSSFTQTEAMMVSVERLEEYSCDVPQEPHSQPLQSPHQQRISWLTQGSVEFQDVVLVYRPGLPNALDGVTFRVEPGEKLGIVGRTGSGKSSLFLVLFRLLEPNAGRVLLDNVDTSQLELAELRSQLAVIPQEPFLFSGTIRENLDPQGLHEDRALWQALEQCHLSEVAVAMGGLDGELGERGQNLSLGQRQLLCLARALLTDAKILCIDEATASVDQKTDQLLQQTICKRFANKTVLTIAHRLNTILNSDRVLVLQAGRVVELDSPSALRNQPHSLFQQLLQSSQQGAHSGPSGC